MEAPLNAESKSTLYREFKTTGFNQNCTVAHLGHTKAKYVFLNLPSKRKSLALFLLVKKCICSCFLKQENFLVVKSKIKSLFLQIKMFLVLHFFCLGKQLQKVLGLQSWIRLSDKSNICFGFVTFKTK